MGQKVHPIGFRLGVIRTWESKWYEEKNYAKWLHEDIKIREFVKEKLGHAGISKIEIERAANKVKINVHTARPGIVIGKRGAGIETIKKDLQALTENEVFLNMVEVRKAETDAQLVAENIATQLERRIAFRRAMKKAVQTAMKFGAKGIRVATLRPPGRRRDGALRVVPRGPRAAAHAARGHRLRLRRGQDHLRQDRREGLDHARRGPAPVGEGAAGRRSAGAPSRPRPEHFEEIERCCSRPGRSTERCRRAACGGRPTAAPTSTRATFGLAATECGWLTSRQIEAARVAISRHVKRGGKLWIRVFPDKPITKKPAETRMGTGKGPVEYYVAVIKPGRVLFEMEGVDDAQAAKAFLLAAHKLPVATKLVKRGVTL